MKSDKVRNITPLGFPWATQDPFLFCAYHKDEYPAGNGAMGPEKETLAGRQIGSDFVEKDGWRMYHGRSMPGFPYHPHRGFETITINQEGIVDHSDSLGAAGRFGAGDVQWMTAGKGILHSEMFPLLNEDRKNPLEMFQVWLNLPKASKFVEPHFRMLWKDMIPLVEEKDEEGRKTEVKVIAGSLNNIQAPDPTPDSWAATTDNDVSILTVKMETHARWTLPKAHKEANRNFYFYRGGSIVIDNIEVTDNHQIRLRADEEIEIINGDKEAYLLILQGRPINEPVAQHGPFVMNTEEEIQDAFREFRQTQFGGWPWPDQEQAHGKDRGRFALHADGTEEIKD